MMLKKKDDLGWHVLLSEDAVGQGHFRAVMRMLSFLILNIPMPKSGG